MAAIFRVLLLIVVAVFAWALGKGGFGWGGGRGDGSGAGNGGASPTQTDKKTAHAWTVSISGDGYQLNGKPLAFADLRTQLEAAKQQIVDAKEVVHIVVFSDARVKAKKDLQELVAALGLPTAQETR